MHKHKEGNTDSEIYTLGSSECHINIKKKH